jgi:hypothetical protein
MARKLTTGKAARLKRVLRRIGRLPSILDFVPPPPLPGKHPRYALIGRVAAEWSQMEHALDLIIWDMLPIDRATASCVTGQFLGIAPRFRAIAALCGEMGLPKELEEAATKLMNRTFTLSDERNRIVHDPWFGWGRTRDAKQFRSRTNKNENFGLVPVKRAEILRTIQSIEAKVAEVSRLHIKIEAALAASGRKLPAPDPAFLSQLEGTSHVAITPGFRPQPFPGSGKKGLF